MSATDKIAVISRLGARLSAAEKERDELKSALAQATARETVTATALERLIRKYMVCAAAHGNDEDTVEASVKFAHDALSTVSPIA